MLLGVDLDKDFIFQYNVLVSSFGEPAIILWGMWRQRAKARAVCWRGRQSVKLNKRQIDLTRALDTRRARSNHVKSCRVKSSQVKSSQVRSLLDHGVHPFQPANGV